MSGMQSHPGPWRHYPLQTLQSQGKPYFALLFCCPDVMLCCDSSSCSWGRVSCAFVIHQGLQGQMLFLLYQENVHQDSACSEWGSILCQHAAQPLENGVALTLMTTCRRQKFTRRPLLVSMRWKPLSVRCGHNAKGVKAVCIRMSCAHHVIVLFSTGGKRCRKTSLRLMLCLTDLKTGEDVTSHS